MSQAKFTPHYLLENLRDVYFAERTGAMTFVRGREWRRVFFDRGMLALAESSTAEENLFAVIGAKGGGSANGLDDLKDLPVLELAASLASSGRVSAQDLEEAARSVVERVVVGTFAWDGGTFSFEDKPVTVLAFPPDVMFTFEVFMRGVQAMTNFAPLKEVLLAEERKLRLNDNAFLPLQTLTLGARQGYVLSRIDGTIRIRDVAMLAPGDEEEEVLRLLFGFLVLGLVLFDPPASEGMFSLQDFMSEHRDERKKDDDDRSRVMDFLEASRDRLPHEVLGLEADAGPEAFKSAYETLQKRYRRERFSRRLRSELKRELALIQNRLLEAYLVLQSTAIEKMTPAQAQEVIDASHFEKRKELVKTEAQHTEEEKHRVAEKYFLKAKDYFKDADYFNCIQFCKLAVKFNPNEAPFFGLMGDALLRNPDIRWQRLAEESYLKALEIDPWNPDYLVALGQLYKRQGLRHRARRHFEKALEILPRHTKALEELGSLSEH